ncbi:hypothetical protein M0813_09382 [Anaeramoeba flamelloides]|uniref:RNA ligase (ATP) n=1 Tax=Anaeramoeba flamelloides TaxID=1746091 RepID=A0ABQ8X5M2_9EUKA|nr:hypothetical protein M0813_09382 [Anaeramoeba flamelloides]
MDLFEKAYRSYNRIYESTNDYQTDRNSLKMFKKTKWSVTEKVHGANLALLTNGETIRAGKRKSLLDQNDEFFDYQKVVGRISNKIHQVYMSVKKLFPETLVVTIYGELFGGKYPHPKVQELYPQPIQEGIYYSNDIHLMAFDISYFEGNEGTDDCNYLDFDTTLEIFQQVDLFHAKPLFLGSFEEALDYPLGFESDIPKLLGHPKIENNKAEGIVIKPLKTINVKYKNKKTRVVIKKKIEEFKETKFSEAKKWTKTSNNNQQDEKISSYQLLVYEIEGIITENRLNNAISKVGKLSRENKNNVKHALSLLKEDVWEELEKYCKSELQNLSNEDKMNLSILIEKKSKHLIVKYIKKQEKFLKNKKN